MIGSSKNYPFSVVLRNIKVWSRASAHIASSEVDQEEVLAPHSIDASNMLAKVVVSHPRDVRAGRQDTHPRQWTLLGARSETVSVRKSDLDPKIASRGSLKT